MECYNVAEDADGDEDLRDLHIPKTKGECIISRLELGTWIIPS